MTMDQLTFERVADKVKARGLQIGAMFCFGEPLLDFGIADKFAYAGKIGVLAEHVGLNTNCSMLTKDRFDGLLAHTPNITLSFFNVEQEFERLTKLSWERCYGNAIAFINERDRACPDYPIFIGVNRVAGHNLPAVRSAFAGFNVYFVQDAEIRLNEGGAIEGMIDRTQMHPSWRCDGYKGAIQIKEDATVEFCAYDIISDETRFGHFLNDGWETLEANFRAAWKGPSTLCQRCDYWYRGKEAIRETGSVPEVEIEG